MNRVFKDAGVALMALVLVLTTSRNAQAESTPAGASNNCNVLFIAVDDLRCELGCYGVAEIKTPNFDRLASSGVMFTRAYCQQAVCNPSRASVMTGLRPDSTHVWDLVTDFRTTIPDAVTLPQHFRQRGYLALGFGKIFHNTFPDHESWDEPHRWPERSQLWSDRAKEQLAEFRKQMKADGNRQAAVNRMRAVATEAVDLADSEHIDGAIADQALSAMRRLAEANQPFFLAAGFVRPHLPFVVPRKYWDLYERSKILLATNGFLPHGAPAVAFGDRSRGGFYELCDYMDYADAPSPFDRPLTESQQRELKHGYYAAVSFIDAQVGRLLDELDRLDLAKNTIVVLWGDHGWKLGEHGGWCKQTNYEIDTRAPLMIRAPGAKANGQQSRALVEFVDIYPTICDLAGLPILESLDGTSLKPLLSDSTATAKDAAFSQFPRRHEGREYMGYAMRTDRYRYVEWQDRNTRQVLATELYDHTRDSFENINVAGDEENRPLAAELSRQMWATLPKPRPDPPKPPPQRPNIVFCMADDWSWPHAGILGDPVVKTPHFDRVAREGVLFENAFVSTPSCTPSRLSILTGQHHWRLKEGDSLGGSLREEFDVYTEMLQDAGYRIGRFGKGVWPSKHQFRGRDSFGERFRSFDAFLDERKAGQPFCYWHGGQDPHRPYELGVGVKSGMALPDVKVPACLPDNETVRGDVADYLWEVQRFDREVGQIIAKLEEIGELDNTILVVSGDNGMPFPRCKGTLYDLGTRVPLAVRWGAKVKRDRKAADFVSLCDFAPTFLEAAGLKPDQDMTGRSLMPLLTSDETSRIDATRDFVLTGLEQHVYLNPARAIRTAEFLFIRNFDPDKWPTGDIEGRQPTYDFAIDAWPTGSGAFSFNIDPSPSKQFLRLNRDDEAVKPLAELSFGRHPVEELYDLSKDPDQVHNVAGDVNYAEVQQRLRKRLDAELIKSRDPRLAVTKEIR